MSLTQLQNEARSLSPTERRRFMACQVSLQTEQDEQFKALLAAKINDRDPSHWVELDDLRRQLETEPLP